MVVIAILGIAAGVIAFLSSENDKVRHLGRVAIGLGLMLFALQQLLNLITPYEDVPSLRLLLGAIATQPLIDVILAAVLTWAAHSSVAVVLLVVSFAAKGVIPPEAAFALVLGANLGTALNPLIEGVIGGDPAAARRRCRSIRSSWAKRAIAASGSPRSSARIAAPNGPPVPPCSVPTPSVV